MPFLSFTTTLPLRLSLGSVKGLFISMLAISGSCGPVSEKKTPEAPLAPPAAPPSSLTPDQKPPTLGSQTVEDIPLDLGPLTNLDALTTRLNLKQYHEQGYHGANLKIGIFDNGFAGLTDSLGKRLPPDLKIEKAFDPRLQISSHGTKMAEIVYALTSGAAEYREKAPHPALYLFNTNGFSNFKAAIDRAIELDLDMILYAQVWEFGGQFDGFGFINAEVSRATKAGIMWVNASGNAGRSTFSGTTNAKPGNFLSFVKSQETLKIVVPQAGTPTKIVLSWGDFKDTKDYKTDIDLDLFLEDSKGQRLQESRLAQTGGDNGDFPGFSAHARESIETTLDSGIYYVKAQYVAGKATSQGSDTAIPTIPFRITATGMGVRMTDGTPDDSLPIPADHPDTLAIGASDVDYSGSFKGSPTRRPRPDLWLESQVTFANIDATQETVSNASGDGIQATGSTINHYGTSAASALAVGALAIYQSAWGTTTTKDLIETCKKKSITCKPLVLPTLP